MKPRDQAFFQQTRIVVTVGSTLYIVWGAIAKQINPLVVDSASMRVPGAVLLFGTLIVSFFVKSAKKLEVALFLGCLGMQSHFLYLLRLNSNESLYGLGQMVAAGGLIYAFVSSIFVYGFFACSVLIFALILDPHSKFELVCFAHSFCLLMVFVVNHRGKQRVLHQLLVTEKRLTKQNAALATMGQAAAQFAHDIGSPLTALKVAVTTKGEEQGTLISGAAKRIREIADELTNKYKGLRSEIVEVIQQLPAQEEAPKTQIVDMIPLINAAVTEKKAELRSTPQKKIKFFVYIPKEAKVEIEPQAFSRILSNLMNNSVNAINSIGRITITIFSEAGFWCLKLQDDGFGIPLESLAQLGALQKEPTNQGTGLGLYHTKSAIESWAGVFNILSDGGGTTVSIKLKIAGNA